MRRKEAGNVDADRHLPGCPRPIVHGADADLVMLLARRLTLAGFCLGKYFVFVADDRAKRLSGASIIAFCFLVAVTTTQTSSHVVGFSAKGHRS